MTFEEKWKNRMTGSFKDDKEYVLKSFDKNLLQKHVRSHLIERNVNIGVNEILNSNIVKAKKRFSRAAMLSEYCFITYNRNWPYWDMKPYSYALLSDNKALIDRYAHLPVDENLIYEDPKKGMPKHFNYTFQGLLREDEHLIQKGLNLLQKDVEKRKEIIWARAHIACTEAIVSKNEDKIKKALLLFEDNRLKSQALSADICENVVSFFPIAYAKIAWFKGLEVDPQSKYMPMELLEVKPLEEYTIPYWFLRDYYREQDVDWRYDPIHPELQDWGNDPENPNRKEGGFFKKLFS